ncbi:MAG: ABC transporter substrate-binding protein [Chloroflexota bacterium]
MKKICALGGILILIFLLSACQLEEILEEEEAPVISETIMIMGSLIGVQEEGINSVIAAFEAENPSIQVDYLGSAEFKSLIELGVKADDPPDIAVFPQPGGVANLARDGKLVPLWDEALSLYETEYNPIWKDLARVDGVPYGVFHRVNAKGWVWYDKVAFEAAGFTPPETWAEFDQLLSQLKETGIAPMCDGIESGVATGWKGTDWIENIMLRTEPVEVYDAWTQHEIPFSSPEVKNAFLTLESYWFDNSIFLGGENTIHLTNIQDPPKWLFGENKTCWLHMQGSFVANWFPEEISNDIDNRVGAFILPPINESLPTTLEVGGELWVVFKGKDRPAVRQFIEFLATPEGVNPWIELGGAQFPHINQDFSLYSTDIERLLATTLVDVEAARFDASDNMDEAVNLAFWEGIEAWTGGSQSLDEVLAEIDMSLP